MKKIHLHGGHLGTTSGATGAPGEQELNRRIRDRLSQILISKGFQVILSDANPPQNELNQDFDLFLALHGDANIYGTGGGVIGYIDSAIDSSPESNAESKRIKEAIEAEYFDHSGIVNHPERNNVNITRYYMWSRLSAKTPCVLLEMGVVQDAHDKVILADTERVATAIARGVTRAFSVAYDPVTPLPPVVNWEKKYNDEVVAHTSTKNKLAACQTQVTDLQRKIDLAKSALI